MKSILGKRLAFGLVFLVAIGTTATVKALDNHTPSIKRTASIQTDVTTPQTASTDQTTVKPSVVSSTSAVSAPVTTPVPAASTPTPKLLYGVDPNNPGIYVVFDKASVMTQAGIPADQQAAAESILQSHGQWTYYNSNVGSDGVYSNGLCGLPQAKLDALAPDWKTNPVSQLPLCNQYIIGKYGSWNNAPLTAFQ